MLVAREVLRMRQFAHEHQTRWIHPALAGDLLQALVGLARPGQQPQHAARHVKQYLQQAFDAGWVELVTVVEAAEHHTGFGQATVAA